jgi:hypothetical protein
VAALALLINFALLAVDSRGYGKGKGDDDQNQGNKAGDDNDDQNEGKKVGKNQIVHGCVTKVTLASGKTLGTVVFSRTKKGVTTTTTVKVTETGTATTVIRVCDDTKTLAQLKTLVEAVKTGQPMYCGIARVDNLTSLMASKIFVCNDDADDDD